MKSIIDYINESKKFNNSSECLEYIINTTKTEPDIWDDSKNWNAKDDFDYYESASGSFDDIVDTIDKYASNKCIAGWKSKDSFEKVEKVIPKLIKDIIKEEPEVPYKKNSNKLELWESIYEGFDVNILRFKSYNNNYGSDYVEFWYMITIE